MVVERDLEFIQADAAPVSQPNANILKQALFNTALQGRAPFPLLGLEFAVILSPSTPAGKLCGPWRTAIDIGYSAGRNKFPWLGVSTTNPNIWQGRIMLHDVLSDDGATFLAQGSLRFRVPIRIRFPDSGLTVSYRPSSEWGQSDVQLVIQKDGP